MLHRLLPLLCALAAAASAQDGGQLFTASCSACHGLDGKGATGGTFPPLAGSPWLLGDGQRAIKIALHGLEGPVNVLGKSFNLAMPPQGAAITDENLAAILTYVRSSWGNSGSAITPAQVKAARAATASRATPWSAEEILKLHPLPLEATALSHVVSSYYSGAWQTLPDFSKLKPDSTEEEQTGIITVSKNTKPTNFGIVWTASFDAPTDGNYTFTLDADDGARLILDSKTLAEINSIGPMNGSRAKQGKVKLTKGSHPIRIEYFQLASNKGLALGWKGPDAKDWKWLSEDQGQGKTAGPAHANHPPIPLVPAPDHAIFYRNFITGVSARSIGFGFPGGVNLAYSADHFAPELVWTGAFMDAGHHWTDRGIGNEPPAGENVVKLSTSPALPESARFKGYKLDAAGNPTFSVKIGEQTLLDSWKPSASTLVRTLTASGGTLTLLVGENATQQGQTLSFGDKFTVQATGAQIQTSSGKSTLTLAPGKPATLTYHWK